MIYLLQSIPDQAWEITPYNGLAYAAIVILLGYLCFKFYKDKEKSDDKRIEVIEKVTALLTMVEHRMVGFERLEEMDRKLDRLNARIDERDN